MGPTGGNMPHGQEGGFLGKAYDPFVLNSDPSKKDSRCPTYFLRLRSAKSVSNAAVNYATSSMMPLGISKPNPSAQLMDTNFASAYRLMTSTKAREAFDLTKEPLKVRERYGMTRFGQSCLLARRLV